MSNYRISVDPNDLEIKVIHQFISNSYWAKGISVELLSKAIKNSVCFSVVKNNDDNGKKGKLVGFARMITDKATFAYLADVFILEAERGNGLSKQLMKSILEHPELQGLRRIVLATSDAHGLYQQFGFKSLASPEIFMELWNPKIYLK